MRYLRLLLILLILFLPYSAYCAESYSGTSQYVEMTNNSVMNIPNGDWAVGGFVQFSSRTGTSYDSIIDFEQSGDAANFFIVQVDQASKATKPNVTTVFLLDSTGHLEELDDTGTPFASNTSPTHLLIQRKSGSLYIYINGTSNNSAATTLVDITPTGSPVWGWGENVYGPHSSLFHGKLWGWAKWSRALSDSEISALAQGFSPLCFQTTGSMDFFYPMGSIYSNWKEYLVPLTVTNTSTTSVADPTPMIQCGGVN